MAVMSNVFRRGSVFYFRVGIPRHLRGRLNRRELWRSLRTSDPGEARRRGGILLSLTQTLWSDLQRAMSTRELQSAIANWLKAKLDEDADARWGASDQALDDYQRRLGEAYGDALIREPRNAEACVDDLVATLGIQVTEAQRSAATEAMMRAHVALLRAAAARKGHYWRPGDTRDDPAAPLLARLDMAAPTQKSRAELPPSRRPLGKLSEVAAEAIDHLAKAHGWRPKRRADYDNAVRTFLLALRRDPDLSEVTRDIAG